MYETITNLKCFIKGCPRGVMVKALDCGIVVEIYKAFCLDVAQGHMKGAPNETRTHSCRFASRAC